MYSWSISHYLLNAIITARQCHEFNTRNFCRWFIQLFVGKNVLFFKNIVASTLKSCIINLFKKKIFDFFWLKIGYYLNFNPKCKRERGFINQLYIELGQQAFSQAEINFYLLSTIVVAFQACQSMFL